MAKNNTQKQESESPQVNQNLEKEPESKVIGWKELIDAIAAGFGEGSTSAGKTACHKTISEYLKQQVETISGYSKYNIVVLFDDTTLVKTDADKVYNAVTKLDGKKPLLLILLSRGGSADSAFLIGKLCREYSHDNFIVSIPRYAKSAATLICCAANEIHMGSLSELGPIDPQINRLPALGLKNSIEHIAELVKNHPASSDMFAKYLHLSLELINLGYYERVAESAMQYAEQLLNTHSSNLPKPAKEIAFDLVYKYKDHGFVIDKSEAELIFGKAVIKKNSAEYEIGNVLYQALDLIKNIAEIFDQNFYFIGSLNSQGTFTAKKR